MKPKLIKNSFDYEMALAYIESLMEQTESDDINEEIELFSSLITMYEDEYFPVNLPDPIDTILFAMDQQGLKRKDLIPIIGNQSKVSEVLCRKRPLSLSMMRNLHEELHIPAEILLQDTQKNQVPEKRFKSQDYPISEMFKLGYFPKYKKISQVKEFFEEIMSELFTQFADETPKLVYCKQSKSKTEPDMNTLLAWQAHILTQVSSDEIDDFSMDALNDSFFEEILSLSIYPKGPLLVKDYLQSFGIHFVIEPHLPKTYVDGSVFKSHDDKPVIVLSLRHDRIDNFWFTLFHELGHVVKHLYGKKKNRAFFDDTFSSPDEGIALLEKEANDFAMEHLISSKKIEASELCDPSLWTPSRILAIAKEVRRSPAILVGRIRYETNNYSLFSDLLGAGEVRYLFYPENYELGRG